MASDYGISWSENALTNLDQIITYLEDNCTEREVENFKLRLSVQLNIIRNFPRMFPAASNNERIRKAVLSKQTSIIYEISRDSLLIVTLLDNRSGHI